MESRHVIGRHPPQKDLLNRIQHDEELLQEVEQRGLESYVIPLENGIVTLKTRVSVMYTYTFIYTPIYIYIYIYICTYICIYMCVG